jgi:hypothetical protein
MENIDYRSPEGLLRLGYGLVPIIAGADKFTDFLVDWQKYLDPTVERMLPVRGRTFMKLVGLIEMAAGATVLTGHRRLGGYLVAGWLGAIALDVIANGDYDIAARDALLALGAFAMAKRAELEQVDALEPGLAVSGAHREAEPAPIELH